MQSDLSRPQNNISLYVMAGVATAPHFMDDFRSALEDRLHRAGREVRSETLFPYGDWGTSLPRQLNEIRHDLLLGVKRAYRSIGGRRVLDSIRMPHDSGGLILIGHSGGGVAAVHAAYMLLAKNELPDCRIVMIGSPRCKIPLPIRESVLYLYAGRSQSPGRSSDPICRLGSFGGWTVHRRLMLRREPGKFAPGALKSLPIIGGHADYFRAHSAFVNDQGESNLDITLESVWSWLFNNSR